MHQEIGFLALAEIVHWVPLGSKWKPLSGLGLSKFQSPTSSFLPFGGEWSGKRRTEIRAYALLENSDIAEIQCLYLPEIGDDVLGHKVVASGLSREAMELIRDIMREGAPEDGADPDSKP